MVAEIAIAVIMATSAGPAVMPEQANIVTETVRVTEYCPSCNSPAGHGSATGKYLTEGDCACGWLPMGTVVEIDGVQYTVVDVCGTDAIDIFRDTDTCLCDMNEYKEAVIERP